MKVTSILGQGVAIAALSVFAAASANAANINFDQSSARADGTLSYDGEGGALVGEDIVFTFGNLDDENVGCTNCRLNFTTGNNLTEAAGNGGTYTFGSGGTFQLTGSIVDGGGMTLADGTLLDGTFSPGGNAFNRSNDTGGIMFASGTTGANDDIDAFFGLDPSTVYDYISTNFSLGGVTYADNGGFTGTVTAADLQVASRDVAVPEPRELAIFGLGLVLLVGGVAARRRSTGGDLLG